MNHPLTRPSGTLSPSEGERDGGRGRFMDEKSRTRTKGRFLEARETGRLALAAESSR